MRILTNGGKIVSIESDQLEIFPTISLREVKKKNKVKDDQLVRLALRQKELFGFAKEGRYPDISKIVSDIDRIIEGKSLGIQQSTAEKKFVRWRTFAIGGLDGCELFNRLMASNAVIDEDALTLLRSPVCSAGNNQRESVDTIILSLSDFGLCSDNQNLTPEDFLSPEFIANWSKDNQACLDGNVVELLPLHAAPYIRYQYCGQPPEDGPLVVATEPIAMPHIWNSNGSSDEDLVVGEYVFELFRGNCEQRILSATHLYRYEEASTEDGHRFYRGPYYWNAGISFLFRFRNRGTEI